MPVSTSPIVRAGAATPPPSLEKRPASSRGWSSRNLNSVRRDGKASSTWRSVARSRASFISSSAARGLAVARLVLVTDQQRSPARLAALRPGIARRLAPAHKANVLAFQVAVEASERRARGRWNAPVLGVERLAASTALADFGGWVSHRPAVYAGTLACENT